jgi:glycosyltransferase involved in cell wall biosynthesis
MNLNRLTRRLGFNHNQTTSHHIPSTSKPTGLISMWSFRGHCAYTYVCTKWQTGCGQCPDLDTYPGITHDTTAIEWKLKNWVYSRSNLTIVTPSQWLTDQARASMLNRFPIHHIPNGIDTDVYQPIDNAQCRTVLNIPEGKHVLMFGAASLNDTRKGGDLIHKALIDLPPSHDPAHPRQWRRIDR